MMKELTFKQRLLMFKSLIVPFGKMVMLIYYPIHHLLLLQVSPLKFQMMQELFFLNLFLTPEIVECLLEETNRYASLYLILHKENLKPTSDAWPKKGITKSKMLLFLALTYYMGIAKKDSLRSYWTIDSVSSTPFPRLVMLRRDFLNILAKVIPGEVKRLTERHFSPTTGQKS